MIMFWEDGKGTKMACPQCKSLNVNQIEKVRGWERERIYKTLVKDKDQTSTSPGDKSVKSGLVEKKRGKLNGIIGRFV
jgi:hypothetical protein